MSLSRLRYGDLRARWMSGAEEDLAQRGTAAVKEMARAMNARATKCSPGDDSGLCEKPTDSTNTQTLPIVLGVVIPLTCAIVVFIILHRRNKKKQAIEDLNDPHKSLDFGFDMNPPPPVAKQKRARRGGPEMSATAFAEDPMRSERRLRGLSMDMIESPYMLPAGLTGSGESLHSMTRSMRDHNDPYRPVVFSRSSSDTARSPHPFNENASTYSRSTLQHELNEKTNLVGNAQRMSRSYPDRGISLSRQLTRSSQETSPPASVLLTVQSELPSRKASPAPFEPRLSESPEQKPDVLPDPSPSHEVVEADPMFTVTSAHSEKELPPPPPRTSSNPATYLPRTDSASQGLQITVDDRPLSDVSYYGTGEVPPPPPEIVEEPEEFGYDVDPSMIYSGRYSIDHSAPSQQYLPQENRLSMMGLRPLPPDHPEESPEQRANRIRSFYKEYFDVNRPNPYPSKAYYEDYSADYVDQAENAAYDDYYSYDGWYDPDSGSYYQAPSAPWAQPAARRAMTPPPRGAPRFAGAHDRHYSTMSGGRGQFRGRPPPPPKKKLPPPKALNSLPTPHMLMSDSALLNASDFAPPTSFREVQNGRRPDSPMGTQRPFSPAVRAYSPLTSTYTGLNPIPSPHELRKSSTFTSLDFSPQVPRFRGMEGSASRAGSRAGSDAGSIRSAHSGISAMQMDAVRSGAYRVSRIPKEFVTSKDDIRNQLRPKLDLTTPA